MLNIFSIYLIQGSSIVLNPLIELRVFEQRNLDGLWNSASPVAFAQGGQKIGIAKHRFWRCKSADEVLFGFEVYTILYTYG